MRSRRDGAARRRSAPSGQEKSTKEPAEQGSLIRDVCIRLLAVRPRTRAELATALARRGFDDDVVAEVLDRYSDVGIIDDEAFARAWVSSRHHGKGLSRRALAGELRRKGVSDDDMGDALGEVDGETEAATARALVERKLRAARSASGRSGVTAGTDGDAEENRAAQLRADAALMRKLVGMLARKGYPSGLAYRVVKEAVAAEPGGGDAAELLDLDAYVEEPGDFDQLRS